MGQTSYTYDSNGNTLSRSNATESAFYVWSAENRLIAATVTGTNSVTRQLGYVYDDDGVRTRSAVTEAGNSTATAHLVDANRPFAQVLEESVSINNQPSPINSVSYTYGHQLLSQNRAGIRSYYHGDHLNSTRALTGQTGTPTDQFRYDAYGRLIGQSTINPQPTANNYLFAGEQRDMNIGLDYLRARYLNFNVGRFYGRDSFDGSRRQPSSLHRFLYVGGSPPNVTDPSGEFSLVEAVATVAIIEILSAVSPTPAFAAQPKQVNVTITGVRTGFVQTFPYHDQTRSNPNVRYSVPTYLVQVGSARFDALRFGVDDDGDYSAVHASNGLIDGYSNLKPGWINYDLHSTQPSGPRFAWQLFANDPQDYLDYEGRNYLIHEGPNANQITASAGCIEIAGSWSRFLNTIESQAGLSGPLEPAMERISKTRTLNVNIQPAVAPIAVRTYP